MKAVGGGGFWRLGMRLGPVLRYGNAFGVESVQWEGGRGGTPPPFQAIPSPRPNKALLSPTFCQLKDHRIAGTFEQHTAKCEGTMRKFADDAEPWHVRLRRESIEAQEAELAALEKRYSNLEASCLSTALNATGR